MRPVKGIVGKWIPARQMLQFHWEAETLKNDRYIYFVEIKNDGGKMRTDLNSVWLFDSRDPKNPSLSDKYIKLNGNGSGKMMLKKFCVYSTDTSSDRNEEVILNECSKDSNYLVDVLSGTAQIEYSIKTNEVKNTKIVGIELNSDTNIGEGIIGYSYKLDNIVIKHSFPAISKGNTKYPDIAIPANSILRIVPYEDKYAGNISITEKKKSLFNF